MSIATLSLDSLRQGWARLARFAIWATAIIATFLLTPPRKTPSLDSDTWVKLAQFVLVIVLGMIIAVLNGRKKRRSICLIASAVFLTLGLAGFFTNMLVADRWTCYYDGHGPMVIGRTLSLDASEYVQKHPGMDCPTLIQDYSGNTSKIWAASEITERHALLVALYLANVLSFALAMLFMLDALRASNTRRRSP
jgi:hypothetical protein